MGFGSEPFKPFYFVPQLLYSVRRRTDQIKTASSWNSVVCGYFAVWTWGRREKGEEARGDAEEKEGRGQRGNGRGAAREGNRGIGGREGEKERETEGSGGEIKGYRGREAETDTKAVGKRAKEKDR